MNKDKLFKMYEKMYYHEIDMRERLNSRLQIPLTIIIILLGFLAFLIRNKCTTLGNSWEIIFWIFLGASAITAFGACICFIFTLYSPVHKLLPTAQSTESYKAELEDYYDKYYATKEDEENESHKEIFVRDSLKQYLYNYYREYSSFNTGLNDRKAYCLHLTNQFLMFSAIFSFLSFIPFYFGNLDKSNHINPTKIILEKPIPINGPIPIILTIEPQSESEKGLKSKNNHN